jgi:transposase
MAGRHPKPVVLAEPDVVVLEQTAHNESLPFWQVRCARTLLGVAAGERIKDVAQKLDCGIATVRRVCRKYERGGLGAALSRRKPPGRPPRLSPLQQAQLVALACSSPEQHGLLISHWSSHDLARQAAHNGLVERVSARTVRRLLRRVDLQPHRTRYFQTARIDPLFKARAEKVLWCYAMASRLAKRGVHGVCTDEMPNLQAVERMPIRRARPGQIERQEFEYVRHGTVNALMFLHVPSGRMEQECVEKQDAAHYQAALRRYRKRHKRWRGVYLIHDGDPSHTAGSTQQYLRSQRYYRVRQTPAHASWLNQAELLNRAFSRRYLRRRSFGGTDALKQHLRSSAPEYNRLYAHPFQWTWSGPKMRAWYARHQT